MNDSFQVGFHFLFVCLFPHLTLTTSCKCRPVRTHYTWHGLIRGCHPMCSIFLYLLLLCVFFTICCHLIWTLLLVIYAVWKSSGVPAARGRISLRLSSMDHLEESVGNHSEASANDDNDGMHLRRGWWDYVPGGEKPSEGPTVRSSDASGFFSVLWRTVGRLWRTNEDSTIAAARKPSLHSEFPLPSVRISENPASLNDRGEPSRSRSPVPSFSSRYIGLRPRMVLLREVMRDEVGTTNLSFLLCDLISNFSAMLYYFHHLLVCCCSGSRCSWSQYHNAECVRLVVTELYVHIPPQLFHD